MNRSVGFIQKGLASFLGLALASQGTLAEFSEKNIWEIRRQRATQFVSRLSPQKGGSTVSPEQILNFHSKFKKPSTLAPSPFQVKVFPRMNNGSSQGTLFIIQDIHLNPEAQRATADGLAGWAEDPSLKKWGPRPSLDNSDLASNAPLRETQWVPWEEILRRLVPLTMTMVTDLIYQIQSTLAAASPA